MLGKGKYTLVKKVYESTHPINIAAHEGDHAKRFAIIGQLGKRRSPYEMKAEKVLREIVNYEERQKGYEYLTASEKYPRLTDKEDLTQNMDYMNNELEVLAREEEKAVREYYNIGRKKMQKQFRYIAGENTL